MWMVVVPVVVAAGVFPYLIHRRNRELYYRGYEKVEGQSGAPTHVSDETEDGVDLESATPTKDCEVYVSVETAGVPVATPVEPPPSEAVDEVGEVDPVDPVEPVEPPIVLETTGCDTMEWLIEASERLEITEGPTLERVDTGDKPATRITFALKRGRREIWLDGPTFMEPMPRLRDPEWKSADHGINFERSASSLERAVLESFVKRE